MRKVNRYHQEILDQAKAYDLNLDNLREKYGLIFVLKLFKYLIKETKKDNKKIWFICPEKNFNYESDLSDYVDGLENAGFKLKKHKEDFIDEDTGEVVGIERYYFKPLK